MADPTISDIELLHSFVSKKDEVAFTEVVRRHQGMMRAVACRVCGDHQDAMDAIQRALIAFARRAGEIRTEPGVGPWLHRATTLEALAVRRQRLKQTIREQEAMEQRHIQTGGMPPDVAAELDEAINKLSPKDRSVIVQHYLENLTFRAIARKHGGTEAAWQKRGVRALGKLSGMLRRRGVVATGASLGLWLAASPAEAAVSSGAMTTMLKEALRQPLAAGSGTQTSTVLLLIMKLKTTLALCFIGGAVISWGWSQSDTITSRPQKDMYPDSSHPSGIGRIQRNEPDFRLERIASAMRHFDSLDEASASAESRLRALMFSVPSEYLDSVLELFRKVDNPDRFNDIAACLYARWAELDPEAAWKQALVETTYQEAARRGVMMTWLNTESDKALAAMMADRKDEVDILILDEFVMGQVQHAPEKAAALVDRLAEVWPRADRRLFEKVARTWAFNDPGPAGEWVGSYWDRDVRNEFLKRFAWRVGYNDYRDGLEMANRIDDPTLRQRARCSSLVWFRGGWHAIQPDVGPPEMDISSGFPDDWNQLEVSAFSEGIMRGCNIQYYDRLLDIARTEQQRQAVYQGTIEGAVYFKPWIATRAVESVSPAYANTETGRNTLGAFIMRWTEHDARAASEWLDAQPDNAKTAVMRKTLQTHGSD